VPLLGNRVDRFVWNGSTLTFDRNLAKLRVFQNDGGPDPPGQGDAAQPARGNQNGGAISFGPDGKLYVVVGDTGRRGQLQNLPSGPTDTGLGPTVPDDQFGGPEPDSAHFTGAILRLNPDGTAPATNPFFLTGAAMGGAVGANLQKVFGYGIRNSFGLAFDPRSGNLWEAENGDSAFDELNLVQPGFNGGWVQTMGPVDRISQFKAIETTPMFAGLQQLRWPPERLADTPAEALSRLFALPGSSYSDPEFSWKFSMPPAGIGFMRGRGIGPQYNGDLFVGTAVPAPNGGPLFHFNLTGNRRAVATADDRLLDRVADNNGQSDLTESESLLVGQDFGIVTDIQTGPNGNLYVVSLSNGAIYEIRRR
jgi:glucose/arabinose dehydrogenase